MNKIGILYLALLFSLFSQCKIPQHQNTNRNNKKGKCYAKCLIPIKTTKIEKYPIYTGNEHEENVSIEVMEIIVQQKSTKWIKKKVDENYPSENSDDSQVWDFVEIPEIKKELKILIDTTQSKNFEIQSFEYETIEESEGTNVVWVSILCKEDLTTSILNQIQISLKVKGNTKTNNDAIYLDSKTKSALTKFQKENGLPIGHLDFKTLDALGILLK